MRALRGLLLLCGLVAAAGSALVGGLDGALRLRGGTGQGGPSRGFKSNGKGWAWRHPSTMSLRAVSKPFGKKPQEKLRYPSRWDKNPRLKSCAEQTPKDLREKRLRDPTLFNPRNDRRGRRDLQLALKDEAFRMGFCGEFDIPKDALDYSWEENMKVPKACKKGRWGYGKPAYDFTNKYIGGPRQG